MAAAIAANPDPMQRLSKRLLTHNPFEAATAEIWRRESEALRECFSHPEHREAVTAFLEKRPANFSRRP